MTNHILSDEIHEPTVTEFNTPVLGLIAVPREENFRSGLVFPEGIDNVTDEHFRQFAAEMKEQYEILEDKYNEIKMHLHQYQNVNLRQREQNIMIVENYNVLLKKICKVIEKNYEQYHFGTPTINTRYNICIPIFNAKTNRLTTYSERTRSFVDIFSKASQ